jgi:sirohydrochlorin cobaltochelatase
VLAAFGSTVPTVQRTYDAVAERIASRFPGHEIDFAFTSSVARGAMNQQGRSALDPVSAVERFRDEGHSAVAIQSLHITPGEEFERLAAVRVSGVRIEVGRPLLSSSTDQDRLLAILARRFRDDAVNIVVAHGNNNHRRFNDAHLALACRLEERYPAAVLASLEGTPGAEPIDLVADQAREVGRVHFVPMLLVAGGHVLEDVMGEGPGSWRNRLGVRETTCAATLGEDAEVSTMFADHLAEALERLRQ